MRSRRGQHQAHWRGGRFERPWWRRRLLALLPRTQFKQQREQIAVTFGDVYFEIEGVDRELDGRSHKELRTWARKNARRAPDHDPHPIVSKLSRVLGYIKSTATAVGAFTFIIGAVLGVQWLQGLGTGVTNIPGTILGVLPPTILMGAGLVVCMCRLDTFVHQALNHDLRVMGGRLQTRDRSQLIGYGIWNGSLNGGNGLVLLMILFVLSTLPRWPLLGRLFDAPDEYALHIVRRYANEVYHCDNYRDVIRTLWRPVQDDL
jgi:hypothetical protein